MKKIAVFHPSNELYGADRIMVLATKALSEFTPVIYLPKNGALCGFIKSELPNAEIKIVPFMPIISRALFSPKGIIDTGRNYLKFKRFFDQEMTEHQFDKIYVNTLACSIMLPAFKNNKVPVITHVHEILENPKIAAKFTAKIAFKYSDTVISVSQAVQNNLHTLCSKRKAKSVVVHNGIPAIQLKDSVKSSNLNFFLFGRIKPEKGQWYLLDALKLIPKAELKGVKFNLVGGTLAGKEELKNELIREIEKNKLTDFVALKGFTNDISGELSKADVCLVPSLMKDPFPTTVLEAMSAGKAVIASDTGGAKEAIEHNSSGFIIPPNSPVIFAETIRMLIRESSIIKEIGHNAERAYSQNFTISHFNTRWSAAVNAA